MSLPAAAAVLPVTAPTSADLDGITEELVARYDRPGPRYTSYPTAPHFTPEFTTARYEEALRTAAARSEEPLSLYVHIPFCAERCAYCGCNVVVSPHRGPEARYLEALAQELKAVAELLGRRRAIAQLHWGGGTPTYLSPAQCEALFAAIAENFTFTDGAELAVEADPCVTTVHHLRVLRRLGFNRLSLGVQDIDEQVQRAVGRLQPLATTQELVVAARELGFASVNVDLIYGLPCQTAEGFAASVETVVEALAPDRAAVFSYAHVPWIKPHQRALEAFPLPRGWAKFRIFAAAARVFLAAGYRFIGMDHFARPADGLAGALERGTLHRNFMGYTTMPASDLVGVGITAIGDVGGAYVQNERNLARYQRTVAAGHLAVERGAVRTAEDELRGFAIRSLICRLALDFDEVERRFGVDPGVVFAPEMAELAAMARDGLVAVGERGVTVLPRGRFFLRNVCMPFDAYLRGEKSATTYSRTV